MKTDNDQKFTEGSRNSKATNAIHSHHKHHRSEQHDGIIIDQYAYCSGMRSWNPSFKVSFAVTLLVLCIVFDNPFTSCLILAASAYLIICKGGVPFRSYLSIQTIPLTFILLGTIAIGIDFSKELIGDYHLFLGFGYLYTDAERMKQMLFLIIKVFAAINALQMMTLSTPSSEIITVLRKAHIPKLIIELMHMIYRYIFILFDVYNKMKNSAASRLGYCDFKTSCDTFGHIAGNMFLISMRKANIYYDAMEARCFDGDLTFLEEHKKVRTKHCLAAVVFLIILSTIYFLTK